MPGTDQLPIVLIVIAVVICILLLLREFYCWYFKINEANRKLDRMVDLLERNQQQDDDKVEDVGGEVKDLSHDLYLLLNHPKPLWLRGIDLSSRDLSGIDLTKADLQNANLAGALLNGTNLTDADLKGAFVYYTDLEGAILSGANLEGADLENAKLAGAIYTEKTVWPQGFDLKSSGAKQTQKP